MFPHPVQQVEPQHKEEALKRVEDAGGKQDEVGEGPEVQEGEAPGGSEEAAEAPDAEEGHSVLPPLVPVTDLSVDQEQHHQPRGHQDAQQRHVGDVMGQ